MYSEPLGYFLTFTVYGTWLHGDKRGSFRRKAEYIDPEPNWVQDKANSFRLSPEQRAVIDQAFVELCEKRNWFLHEKNVRTNHVHIVVTAPDTKPERVMADMKAKATRSLRKAGLFPEDEPLWTEHGSTIYLFTQEKFDDARIYVRDYQ